MSVDDRAPRRVNSVVVIDPTEDQMKRVRMVRGGQVEELKAFDWDIIGGRERRIDIPLDRPMMLRSFIPDQLRALATFMETTMRRDDLALRSQLFEIGARTRLTGRVIRAERAGRDVL